MTPIEKNGQASSEHIAPILVEDERGNALSPTYPRRAKGLVKSGRAVWTDETRTAICLLSEKTASVRRNITEEIMMNNENRIETAETLESRCSIDYILQKMEEMSVLPEYIKHSIQSISTLEDGITGAQSMAISEVVKSRETTNQQLLKMYETMYNDLMGKESKRETLREVLNWIEDMDFDTDEAKIKAVEMVLNALY